MKNRSKHIIIGFILFAVSYLAGYVAEGKWAASLSDTYEKERDCMIRCLENGSVSDYKTLLDATVFFDYPDEILFTSIVMALKYDYIPANYDVYHSLVSFFKRNPGFGGMDATSQDVASYFLKRGVELGDERAIAVFNDKTMSMMDSRTFGQ